MNTFPANAHQYSLVCCLGALAFLLIAIFQPTLILLGALKSLTSSRYDSRQIGRAVALVLAAISLIAAFFPRSSN